MRQGSKSGRTANQVGQQIRKPDETKVRGIKTEVREQIEAGKLLYSY